MGKESLTSRSKKHSESRSSGNDDDYVKAVESIVDEVEGGEFKVINKAIDVSGPPDARALEGALTKAHSLSSRLPKVEHLTVDESQANKVTYRQIHAGCDRGNIAMSHNMELPFASRCGTAWKNHRGGPLNHLSAIQDSTSERTPMTTSRSMTSAGGSTKY